VRLPRRAERDPTRTFVEGNIPRETGFQRVSARTLGEVKDKGKGAENLIWLAGRQSGRGHALPLSADEILAGLTERIAELEARVSAILAEVEPEPPRVNSERGRAMSAPKADAGGGTHNPNRDTRVEADDELTRASEERRLLANEMRLLRGAIQEARRSQPSAGLGANAVEARAVPDLRAAIADEMRVLLAELFADFRSRAIATPPPVLGVPPKGETTVQVAAATPAAIVEDVVKGLQTAAPVVEPVATAPPPIVEHVDELVRPTTKPLIDESVEDRQARASLIDTLANVAALIETSESIVEHVDELVRPTTKPLIDNSVADLRGPEPVARIDVSPVEAAPVQPAAAILEEYEEFFQTEPAPSIADFEVAPPELAPPVVDEHGFGPAEPVAPIIDEYVEELRRPEVPPLTETFYVSPAPAKPIDPIIDEFIEQVRRPQAPPMETVELSAGPTEPIEANIDEFIEELRRPEPPPPLETIEMSAAPAEPIEPITDEHVEELPRSEFSEPVVDLTITPPAPPSVPDPRLAALWEAAPVPTEAESAPPAQPEPASFITEDFIAETRPLEIPEAPPEMPQEFAQEQTIEFPPPQEFPLPPQEFPLPPQEFPLDPAAIVEPEHEAWTAEPLISQPEQALSFSSMFPELTVADERGLHQIQVVISPIHSFPRLLETERRIRALSTVNALHLRDFRNGVATLTVAVSEAISPAEFGAVIQMLEILHLRLKGATQSTVELHADDEPPTS
jgi:hypothetical protein